MNNATNIRHFAFTVYAQHKNFLLKGRALQGHRQGATYAGWLLCGSPQKGRGITRSGDCTGEECGITFVAAFERQFGVFSGVFFVPFISKSNMEATDYNTGSLKSPSKNLSPREQEVLEGLSTGKSYKMIADSLGISPNTMPTLIRRLYKKLGVNSATGAIYKTYLNRED